MKKKIASIVILAIGIISLTFYFLNKPYYSLTIDINPSIQIDVDRHDKVIKIKALNEDAKKIIIDNYNGNNLSDVLTSIVKKSVDNDYADDNHLIMLVYSTKEIDMDKLQGNVLHNLNDIELEIIKIDSITKEDINYAKKHDITPAKAAYINLASGNNEEIIKDALLDKSIFELKEAKESGMYCDDGYTLQGAFCAKKIGEEPAKKGMVCEKGYQEYNGKCYADTRIIETGNYYCDKNDSLEGTKCIKTIEEKPNPIYECEKGELTRKGDVNPIGSKDNDNYYCVDKTNAKKPTLRCLTNPGHIMINGKCYNGPAPLINGGCPGKDKVVNGKCYSLDDEDQWVCPNGSIYEKSKNTFVELCPDTFKYITPSVKGYTCNEGFLLENNKCIRKDEYDAMRERACEKDGYSLVNNSICINLNKVKNMVEGYYCDKENSRLEDNKCILQEVVDSKRIGDKLNEMD